MKTLKPSLFVQAALAGILAAAVAAPARADHHGGEKKEKAKHEKKEKSKHEKKGAAAEKAGDAKVHCLGVNSCKGTSECGVEGKHGCHGANACKGQGWTTLTKKDCLKQKGSVVADKGAEHPEVPAKAEKAVEKAAEPAKK